MTIHDLGTIRVATKSVERHAFVSIESALDFAKPMAAKLKSLGVVSIYRIGAGPFVGVKVVRKARANVDRGFALVDLLLACAITIILATIALSTPTRRQHVLRDINLRERRAAEACNTPAYVDPLSLNVDVPDDWTLACSTWDRNFHCQPTSNPIRFIHYNCKLYDANNVLVDSTSDIEEVQK